MAVADLQERQCMRLLRCCLVDKAQRVRDAAGNGPQHAGSHPRHAFENFAPADAVFAVEFAHCLSPLKPRRPLRMRSGNSAVYSRPEIIFLGGPAPPLLYPATRRRAPPGATATRKTC